MVWPWEAILWGIVQADQAEAGLMKPYFMGALIQRGALRWTDRAS
jgi:hypothetical protein